MQIRIPQFHSAISGKEGTSQRAVLCKGTKHSEESVTIFRVTLKMKTVGLPRDVGTYTVFVSKLPL
jgi:hypothetical protein